MDILVETVILLSMHNQSDAARILSDAAQVYKVDVEAISATVKQEFAAGKGQDESEGHSQIGIKAHEKSSRVVPNQFKTLARSQHYRLRILRARAARRCPPSCDAPELRRGVIFSPARRAAKLSGKLVVSLSI